MSTITNAFTPTTPIRTAIIGCGRIAGIHVASIREVPGAEVVAVCDLNEDAARKLAGEHKIAAWYTDARKMFEEARPNVVHVVTPPRSHLGLIELAAAHGCGILAQTQSQLDLRGTATGHNLFVFYDYAHNAQRIFHGPAKLIDYVLGSAPQDDGN